MPIVELSNWELVILVVIISPLIELAVVLLGRKVGLEHLTTDKWWFKLRKWEDGGNFYRKYFKVHKWKKYLPDGAKFFKGDFTKNRMHSFEKEYMETFIAEACRAEMIHTGMIIPFIFYFLIAPPIIYIPLLVLVCIINIPCIVAQRYNRPRIKAAMNKRQLTRKIEEEASEEAVECKLQT